MYYFKDILKIYCKGLNKIIDITLSKSTPDLCVFENKIKLSR